MNKQEKEQIEHLTNIGIVALFTQLSSGGYDNLSDFNKAQVLLKIGGELLFQASNMVKEAESDRS